MKILVTGATGFTGERVLPMLMGEGEIRCFVRPSSNIQKIKDFGYELYYGDLIDLESLKTAMAGCDALINIASLGFGRGPGIVKTAEEAGIRRAVFISTTALFTQLHAKSKSIRREAEDCIKASKLDWTILRPTMIYGAPGDRNIIRLIRFIDRWPLIPVVGSGNYLQQPVYVEDVAESIVSALLSEKTAKREFNISGKYAHTFIEIIDLIAQALGKRIKKVHIPSKISLYAITLFETFSKKPWIKSEQIMRLNEHKNFDYSSAREAFGYDPISFKEGITKEVALYRQLKNKGRG